MAGHRDCVGIAQSCLHSGYNLLLLASDLGALPLGMFIYYIITVLIASMREAQMHMRLHLDLHVRVLWRNFLFGRI